MRRTYGSGVNSTQPLPVPLRGGGRVLIAGGLLFVLATLLHPSQETPTSILETEPRLVGSHAVWIVSYLLILLGLTALYLALSDRVGLSGFLAAFVGTALLAISSQFGFIAPVLAAEAPDTLDAITNYWPVVAFNGLAATGFMVGYVLLGISIAKSRVLPSWSGITIAIGAPLHLIGFGIAQLTSPDLWFLAILGSLALGFGPGLVWTSNGFR